MLNTQEKHARMPFFFAGVLLCCTAAAFFLCGCSAVSPSPVGVPSLRAEALSAVPPREEAKEEEAGKDVEEKVEEAKAEGEEEKEGTLLGAVLLYIPNRIFDAVEIARAGVNVGIGLGVDMRITWLAQLALQTDTSVGLGFQGFRHLPVCARLAHSVAAVGPMKKPSVDMMSWPVNPYDVRVELFALLAGAHAAVDLEAVVDLVLGFFFLDPSGDDFVL